MSQIKRLVTQSRISWPERKKNKNQFKDNNDIQTI